MSGTWAMRGGKCWQAMIARCHNPKHHKYPSYGGRGIAVCERWRGSFSAFLEDMGPRPSPDHSIDRHPNRNGNYEPDNCRWALAKTQNRNKDGLNFVTHGGETKCLSAWAEDRGIRRRTLRSRIERGWPLHRALGVLGE